MRTEIEQLTEAIAGTVQPLVGVQSKAEPEDEDLLDERSGHTVSMTEITKLADAMVESPGAVKAISNILKKAAGSVEGKDPPSNQALVEFREIMRGFLQNSLPVLLQGKGMKVQAAAAGKGRRGLKALGAGKGMAEVMEMWDEPLSEGDSSSDDDMASLKEELEEIL